MAKENAAEAPAVSAPEEFKLGLHEFCTRLSTTDRRVEMIGGFEHSERVAGRLMDTEPAYQSRFVAFLIQPTA